jgi:hypothetical protein
VLVRHTWYVTLFVHASVVVFLPGSPSVRSCVCLVLAEGVGYLRCSRPSAAGCAVWRVEPAQEGPFGVIEQGQVNAELPTECLPPYVGVFRVAFTGEKEKSSTYTEC